MATTSNNIQKYIALEVKLLKWRSAHPQDTPEEDALLDEMDRVWWSLTPAERAEVESRPPGERHEDDDE
jgi:hypothetical protein